MKGDPGNPTEQRRKFAMRKFYSTCPKFDWNFYERVIPSGKHAAHAWAPASAMRAQGLRSTTVLVQE
jgi:hypothetical protein